MQVGQRLRVIEPDVDRARLAAERLSRTVVLNGSALDEAILRGLSIGDARIDIAFRRVDGNVAMNVLGRQGDIRATMTS